MKKKHHVIISVSAEKVFEKLQQPPTNFHDKHTHTQLEIGGKFLNLIKDIYGQLITWHPVMEDQKPSP